MGRRANRNSRATLKGSPDKWEERWSYRGIVSHVYDGNLHVFVREDSPATKLR
jgi:hypothetical protein